MIYQEQLGTRTWKLKRLEIIKRDHHSCFFCHGHVSLEVHHKYYSMDAMAWEYPNDALITLCRSCHEKLHSLMSVEFYEDIERSRKIQMTPCKRCQGYGYLAQYRHVENGVCFRCHGSRYEELIDQQHPFEAPKLKLDSILFSIKDVLQMINNKRGSYQFEGEELWLETFEENKDTPQGWYKIVLGDTLKQLGFILDIDFIDCHGKDLKIMEIGENRGMFIVPDMETDSSALRICDDYFKSIRP